MYDDDVDGDADDGDDDKTISTDASDLILLSFPKQLVLQQATILFR
jgi:hypothetical protein